MSDLHENERPREKLISAGSANDLSNAELLAILLRTGTKGHSVLEISRDIIQEYQDNLPELSLQNLEKLTTIPGIGNDKAATLLAAFELGRRVAQKSRYLNRVKITTPIDVVQYFIHALKDTRTESLHCVCLTAANAIINHKQISNGGIDFSVVDPREIFHYALQLSAKSIILVHNHPSGNVEPSKSDIAITKQVKQAGALLQIELLDHIIIAGNGYTSLKEKGFC